MINDTPNCPKARITQNFKSGSKPAYEGGFHLKSDKKCGQNKASKRSSTQTFTCK